MSSHIAFAQRYKVFYDKVEGEADEYEDDHFDESVTEWF